MTAAPRQIRLLLEAAAVARTLSPEKGAAFFGAVCWWLGLDPADVSVRVVRHLQQRRAAAGERPS